MLILLPSSLNPQWVLKVAGVTNVDPVTLDRDNPALTRDPLSGNLLYIVSLTAEDSPAPGGTRTRRAFATVCPDVYWCMVQSWCTLVYGTVLMYTGVWYSPGVHWCMVQS